MILESTDRFGPRQRLRKFAKNLMIQEGIFPNIPNMIPDITATATATKTACHITESVYSL